MTTVLWLSDPATYRLLKTHRPELAEQALICTADLETLWVLQRDGVPVRSLWRLVTLDDQLSIAAQARELADSWTAGLADVSYQDVHLGALCQTSLLYTFRDVLLAQCMAARFLDEVRPTRLLISPGAASSSAGQQSAAWIWEATQRQIPVEMVPDGQPGSSPSGRPARRPHPARPAAAGGQPHMATEPRRPQPRRAAAHCIFRRWGRSRQPTGRD